MGVGKVRDGPPSTTRKEDGTYDTSGKTGPTVGVRQPLPSTPYAENEPTPERSPPSVKCVPGTGSHPTVNGTPNLRLSLVGRKRDGGHPSGTSTRGSLVEAETTPPVVTDETLGR